MSLKRIVVSANRCFLATESGEPFVWLGDTAWELFHRLNREEAGHYLQRRAAQGFNVIQAAVLAENDGLRTGNAYGDLPLIDLNPAKPNEDYFQHVDWIVNTAECQGLFVGMLPTWGDKLFSLNPATGPIVFNSQNAYTYGQFLGARYRDKPIIWILGGDRNVDSLEVLEIWRALARGLRDGDDGSHLITFHPRGEHSSSVTLHNEPWLDFNMYQSGHARRPAPVYRFTANDVLLQPRKPVVDGEPPYEDIPIAFWEFVDWQNPQRRVPSEVLDERGLVADRTYFVKGFFNDHDVRVHAYWNFLSGACGYTYGNNAVWQMYRPGQEIAIPCLNDWEDALERPGAQQMKHVRTLFETHSLAKLVPDQSLVYGPNPEGADHIRSAGSSDGSFALLYLPQGKPVSVVLGKTTGSEVAACWFNPRTGEITTSEDHANTGIVQFAPPDEGAECDWVLILNAVRPQVEPLRPRVVILSDFPPIDVIPGTCGFGLPEKVSDPDDVQSMIRLLVYANDLEIEGLAASAGTLANVANKQGLLDVLNLYDRVDENLRRHDLRYPTANHLRSVTWLGSSDTYARPAQEIIGPGLDSEASDALIATVDRPDPRPLWILAWTGPRELAQALWKIRETRTPAETAQFIRKLRVYLIALQDGTGQWLLDEFPDLFIIHSAANWNGMIFNAPGSNSRLADLDWLNRNVRKGHGLLGLCYPESGWEHDALGVKEGDSPSFLHLLSGVRGLNDPERPDQPGWGGRFVRLDPTRNHWSDDPEGPQTVWRWREQVQADFAARMDWCLDV